MTEYVTPFGHLLDNRWRKNKMLRGNTPERTEYPAGKYTELEKKLYEKNGASVRVETKRHMPAQLRKWATGHTQHKQTAARPCDWVLLDNYTAQCRSVAAFLAVKTRKVAIYLLRTNNLAMLPA